MNNNNREKHLDENAICMWLVDEQSLPPGQLAHLSHCQACRAELERTARALTGLGGAARKMAPSPKRNFRLPEGREVATTGRKKISMGLAATAIAGIIALTAVIRFAPEPFAPAPPERTAAVSAGPNHGSEGETDEMLMTQIDELLRDPLPDSFQAVAGFAEPEFEDEDLMDFIVPDIEEDGDITQTTKENGALSC